MNTSQNPIRLQLSLKSKWFEMTKAGIKTEDYREITPYWLSRFILVDEEKYYEEMDEMCAALKAGNESTDELFKWFGCEFRKFDQNVMTLGYPKRGDAERILKLEHKGIEIRTGNPDWGAEPGKLYFVIMHGDVSRDKQFSEDQECDSYMGVVEPTNKCKMFEQ
jgi:hypothetical protein